jgi:hypothetical protein
MKARLQLTGHHLQMVSALVVVRYWSASMKPKPRNRLGVPATWASMAHSAAPIAPASPD